VSDTRRIKLSMSLWIDRATCEGHVTQMNNGGQRESLLFPCTGGNVSPIVGRAKAWCLLINSKTSHVM
jgi:hypothetical protein